MPCFLELTAKIAGCQTRGDSNGWLPFSIVSNKVVNSKQSYRSVQGKIMLVSFWKCLLYMKE